MKLYVARHGETTWNVVDKICGRTDAPLTDKGRAQAAALAEKAGDKGIEVIIASPLQRAYETAMAVSEKIGVPVFKDERLMEQHYGVYEGMSRFDEGFLADKRQFAAGYPGGESMFRLAHRIYGFLDDVKERYPDQTVLLVCHNGVCRVIHSYFERMTNEEFAEFGVPNACLLEYEL